MTVAARVAAIAASVSAVALGAVLLLAPGTSGAYTAAITNSNNTAASSAAFFTCSSAFAADKANALFAYPLNEATGSTTAVDAATGSYPGTYRGGMTSDTTSSRACSRDTGGAYVLDGSDSVTNALQAQGPATFSTEVWFKTTVKGGKLIGFGNSQAGSSSAYDRHTYVSTTGQLSIGTYNGGYQTIHELRQRRRRRLASRGRHDVAQHGHDPVPRRRPRRPEHGLHRPGEQQRLLADRLRQHVGVAERGIRLLRRQHALRGRVQDGPHRDAGPEPLQRRPLTRRRDGRMTVPSSVRAVDQLAGTTSQCSRMRPPSTRKMSAARNGSSAFAPTG